MNIKDLINKAESLLSEQFNEIEEIALFNQEKVLDAFRNNSVALRHFSQTNGYGYDDIGRDTLCNVFADIFASDSAIVSPLLVSGTHTLTVALFGMLRPNDELLSITGAPYDTLNDVINGENNGSLKDFNISYKQVDLKNNALDDEAISRAINSKTKVVFIGRSRGYQWRNALSISDIKHAVQLVKSIKNDVIVMCDNCYGEFTDMIEPTQVGVDVIAGSLIKNPGGGLAPTGGYICGRKDLIEKIAFRMTSPSIGMEVGSYAYGYKDFYQGIFLAPHTTMNAIKGSLLFGKVFELLGFETMPLSNSHCNDIIRSIKFDTKEQLIKFCQAIQKASPIDSNVMPLPWAMPGYDDEVIMAAGTFVAGASIELSADSPIKEPYIAYLQGGLTYEHVKIALKLCLQELKLL